MNFMFIIGAYQIRPRTIKSADEVRSPGSRSRDRRPPAPFFCVPDLHAQPSSGRSPGSGTPANQAHKKRPGQQGPATTCAGSTRAARVGTRATYRTNNGLGGSPPVGARWRLIHVRRTPHSRRLRSQYRLRPGPRQGETQALPLSWRYSELSKKRYGTHCQMTCGGMPRSSAERRIWPLGPFCCATITSCRLSRVDSRTPERTIAPSDTRSGD